ncbi:hypothetical protein NT2_01_02230 [Caenibius tardaugens NBRC 16725]|uniref:DUF1214 domain-containing protein n=1 Tax=Caenibius tardaugens NBRC 16725 TaxID=1219035 RepID=U2YH98_9SPHN|nr:DUF1214 domain-containing protein [Caenibius tardaugens]AZI37293.1 DUF1214 domain-containing protein [Caenibius tardaugens NBRC 16725]GAD47455.1 hypothetical protein NT2_01_02230 [Caenibius tardaugens NBRC 16725]
MDVRLSDTWRQFCMQLAEAGSVLDLPNAPGTAIDQAEGLRYLSRLTRAAFESIIEGGNPDFPRFYRLTTDTLKIGGDNPDNLYMNATIRGDRDYVITGTRGSVSYLSFGTKANRFAIDGKMASTGELEDAAMDIADDGRFTITLSATPQEGNWLPMQSDSTMLLVRQTFLDRADETPADLQITCLNRPERPAPADPDAMAAALTASAGFATHTARAFAGWSEMFMSHPNTLSPWDQTIFQNVGGDPNIHYLHGYWKLEPGEAWLIETEVPECRFWNFVLQNWWMESADYTFIPNAYLTKRTARFDSDGVLRIVVAERDPGVGNWIDTTGHRSGTALLRWISANDHPIPRCRVVPLDSL